MLLVRFIQENTMLMVESELTIMRLQMDIYSKIVQWEEEIGEISWVLGW